MRNSGKQFRWKWMTAFLIVNMFAGFLYILVKRPGNMQDASYWVYRIGALADEMAIQGVFRALPPRILSVTFNGYGYGAPLFYCDVFLWLPAVLVLMGVSEFTSYTILCAAIWGMRALAAFYSAALVLEGFPEIKNRHGLAVLSAFSYSFFPYMLEILLVRGAIGESLASIFLPLLAATLYQVMHEKNRNPQMVILLALGFFGVVCSHTVSIIITACGVAIYVSGHLKQLWAEKWRIAELFKACMLAVGLSAFWLFPFMEQYFAHIIPDAGGWWWHNILNISDWFISYYYTKDRLVWFPSTFGILLVAWTILYLVHRRAHKNRSIGILLGISWLLCIFMTSRTAMKALENVFGFMQFAWRFLSVVALLLTVIIIYVFYVSSKKRTVFVTIYVLYVVCILSGDIAWYRAAWVSDTSAAYGANNADGLYIPQGGIMGMHDIRGELVDANLDGLQFEWERLPKAQLRLKYSNNTGNAVVQLPLFYYKGYEAYDVVNQSSLAIEKGDVGLIWVHLDPYEAGEIIVSYAGTDIQRISDIVSFMTWIALLAFLAGRRKLRKI